MNGNSNVNPIIDIIASISKVFTMITFDNIKYNLGNIFSTLNTLKTQLYPLIEQLLNNQFEHNMKDNHVYLETAMVQVH